MQSPENELYYNTKIRSGMSDSRQLGHCIAADWIPALKGVYGSKSSKVTTHHSLRAPRRSTEISDCHAHSLINTGVHENGVLKGGMEKSAVYVSSVHSLVFKG